MFLDALLGTGIAAHVLSSVYLLFLTFVPISIGISLVWSTDTASGLWWLNVVSINWVLGAVSYFIMPSMGPAFVFPEVFADLPQTGVLSLQNALLEHRQAFLQSPVGSGELQSIAAFASLHVAIVFAGALMAHLLRIQPLRIGLWLFLFLTVLATIYFGWHWSSTTSRGLRSLRLRLSRGQAHGWRISRRGATRTLQLRGA